MKIAIITGSRADQNALVIVGEALTSAGHTTELIDVARNETYRSPFSAVRYAFEEVTAWLPEQGFDLAFVHGDRHEIVGAAMAANLARVPIAHLGGGDITIGSQDDCYRHAITKLSHVHFATNRDSAARIIQMGEEPAHVHAVGDPGVDFIARKTLFDRTEAFRQVGFSAIGISPDEPFILVSLHPDTISPEKTAVEVRALSNALLSRPDIPVLFNGPNADAGHAIIMSEWSTLSTIRPKTVYMRHMDPMLFLTLVKESAVMVGNSSAAYYEASYFGTQAVDIGNRQTGRHKPLNVVRCIHSQNPYAVSLLLDSALKTAGMGGKEAFVDHYYGDGHACERIVEVVNALPVPTSNLLVKKFQSYTLDAPVQS